MKCVVGLGNAGVRYDKTRHNVGFAILDALSKDGGTRWRSYDPLFELSRFIFLDSVHVLVKPLTFMNESGRAVHAVLSNYTIKTEDLLFVFDDLSLPLGTLRLRKGGSHGGHNGLLSVSETLATDNFSRLRVGILTKGTPEDRSLIPDFVLSRFEDNELPFMDEAVNRAVQCIKDFFVAPMDKIMNTYNQRTTKPA